MTADHDRIDELLAGYVLRSLSGADAVEADRLLSDHVPACRPCRATLDDFRELTGELAVATDPFVPPETLLPRLHRELGPRPSRRTGAMQVAAVAASVALIVGLAGVALTQGRRAGDREARAADMAAALDMARRPDASLVPVGPMTEISAPGEGHFYLYGRGVPAPRAGMTYRVWLVVDDTVTYAGDLAYDAGTIFLIVDADPATVQDLMITAEPEDATPGAAPGEVVWQASAA